MHLQPVLEISDFAVCPVKKKYKEICLTFSFISVCSFYNKVTERGVLISKPMPLTYNNEVFCLYVTWTPVAAQKKRNHNSASSSVFSYF